MAPLRSAPRRPSAVRGLAALASVTGAFVLAHCGAQEPTSTFAEQGYACASDALAGKCGQACVNDATCPEGTFCGSAGGCFAQCLPGDTCAGGLTCSPRGRCGGDPLPPSPPFPLGDASVVSDAIASDACVDVDVTLAKVRPTVLLALDQSSSMFWFKFPSGASNNCNPDCRWTVLKDVLIGPAATPGGLLKQIEGDVDLGMQLYSATDPNPNDGDNSLLTTPTDPVCPRFNGRAFAGLAFAPNNFASIDAMLRPAEPDDDTPTGEAIDALVGVDTAGTVVDTKGFASAQTQGPKTMILVTDGEPALCASLQSTGTTPARARVEDAVARAHAKQIRTFVVAIGDVTDPGTVDHFNRVARRGQGQDPVTGTAEAVRPTDTTALVTALREIILGQRTCVFKLDGTVQPGTETKGSVVLNGQALGYNDPNGWKLNSPTELELVGAACNVVKTEPDAQLSMRFPCGAFVPQVPR